MMFILPTPFGNTSDNFIPSLLNDCMRLIIESTNVIPLHQSGTNPAPGPYPCQYFNCNDRIRKKDEKIIKAKHTTEVNFILLALTFPPPINGI